MLDTTPVARLQAFLAKFEAVLAAGDVDVAAGMFGQQCYWRDLVAFTWNIKTMEGRDEVRDVLAHCLKRVKPRDWRIAEGEAATEAGGVLESFISFETEIACGYGLIRIMDGLIWTLLTTMVELKGHEEKAGFTRPLGARHGVNPGAKTWKELRDEETEKLGYDEQPYVVIIGGGQGGIGLGARLRQLGVPTIIVEKNERVGDSWRKRYKSLCLHDPVWYDHLPYIDFPKRAGVLAEGQDRRLAGNVRQGDGAELLDQDDGQARELRSGQKRMDGRRRSRRQGGQPAAQAVGVRDRHVLKAE
jgi:putative flavoprotein involved in K+ transport